jgi:hypothetical protein
MLALVFLLFRPQGCSASASSSGYDGSDAMFYREAGQFKTTYAQDQRSSRSCRTGWRARIPRRVLVVVPPSPATYWLSNSILVPFLVFSWPRSGSTS